MGVTVDFQNWKQSPGHCYSVVTAGAPSGLDFDFWSRAHTGLLVQPPALVRVYAVRLYTKWCISLILIFISFSLPHSLPSTLSKIKWEKYIS